MLTPKPIPFAIRVAEAPICPKCGGNEVLLGGPVRPFKIDMGRGWESNCTDCDLWFLADGTITEQHGSRTR